MNYFSVFTYGTLQVPDVMSAVCGGTFKYSEAILPDYVRYKVKKQVFPGIVKKPGSSVKGILYYQVDSVALELLDVFEADFYERRSVVVDVDGTQCQAEAYIVAERYRNLLEEMPWSLEEFRKNSLIDYLASC